MDNIIFKITEYYESTKQIVVVFCKKTSEKPIDDFSPIAIDLKNLDMSGVNSFFHSLLKQGLVYLENLENSLPIHPSNICDESKIPNSLDDMNKFLNVVVHVDSYNYPENFDYLEKVDL
jgi:hypothetical protein